MNVLVGKKAYALTIMNKKMLQGCLPWAGLPPQFPASGAQQALNPGPAILCLKLDREEQSSWKGSTGE